MAPGFACVSSCTAAGQHRAKDASIDSAENKRELGRFSSPCTPRNMVK